MLLKGRKKQSYEQAGISHKDVATYDGSIIVSLAHFINHMNITNKNKRIATNTVYLYVRMIIVMFVSFYTSRIVLKALGTTDFGIYNVVGGIVSLLAFFTSSLSNAAQRYLCIGMAESAELTSHYFRQCFTLMLIFSVLLLLFGETIGLWFVYHKLVIPPDRFFVALWIYQFSLFSVVLSINQIVFIAVIIAREQMTVYAWLGLFEAFLKLSIAILLLLVDMDLLLIYGLLTALSSLLIFLLYFIYCKRNFLETKCAFVWDKSLVKDMAKFVGYNLFGCFAYSGGILGTNILLNLFFGPLVNAARGISMQLTSAVNKLTNGIMTALAPPIIKSYAENNIDYMLRLIEKGSKYMAFLSSLIFMPLILEMEFVLNLWLVEVPQHTVAFARISLVEQMIGVFVSALWIAANATGEIKNIQVYGRLFTLSALPLSYVLLHFTLNPCLPLYLLCLLQIGYWAYCLYDIHSQLHLSITRYVQRIVCPVVLLILILSVCGYVIVTFVPEDSALRFCIVILVMLLVGMTTIYALLDKNEQKMVRRISCKFLRLS